MEPVVVVVSNRPLPNRYTLIFAAVVRLTTTHHSHHPQAGRSIVEPVVVASKRPLPSLPSPPVAPPLPQPSRPPLPQQPSHPPLPQPSAVNRNSQSNPTAARSRFVLSYRLNQAEADVTSHACMKAINLKVATCTEQFCALNKLSSWSPEVHESGCLVACYDYD